MSSVNKSLLIPLIVFILLVVTLGVGFSLKDPHILPSELIDRPFPDFEAAELHDVDRILTREDLKGEVVSSMSGQPGAQTVCLNIPNCFELVKKRACRSMVSITTTR